MISLEGTRGLARGGQDHPESFGKHAHSDGTQRRIFSHMGCTRLWHQEYSLIRIALPHVHTQARAYLFSETPNLTFTAPRKYLVSCLPVAPVLIHGYGLARGTHCCRLTLHAEP